MVSSNFDSNKVDDSSVEITEVATMKLIAKDKARLKWACRRGMLELDVLFMPFVDDVYEGLSFDDRQTFERLLTCQDPELFAWFMGHEECKDDKLNAMVQFILGRVKV